MLSPCLLRARTWDLTAGIGVHGYGEVEGLIFVILPLLVLGSTKGCGTFNSADNVQHES